MIVACSSCKYLVEKKKYKGKVGGAKYFCSKTKCYVYGDSDNCKAFEKSYTRKAIDCDKIYEEGKSFYDDDKSVGHYVIILVALLILLLVLKLLGNA